MPVLVLIYIMNYMDRTSVTQARLYRIQEELGLSGAVWQTGISILSVPYICEQPIRFSFLIPRFALAADLCISCSDSWDIAHHEDKTLTTLGLSPLS